MSALKTLVIGMGNLLLADEGVGVHAVHALSRECRPPGTEILEVGTAILEALPALEKAEKVIVLDAMKAGGEPGTLYRTTLDQCASAPRIASMHGFDLRRVLALTGREDLPEVIILGVEPASIHWSMALSSRVSDTLPRLLQALNEELGCPA